MRRANTLSFLAIVFLGLSAGLHTGCATSPQTAAQRSALTDESQATLAVMQERDPQLKQFLGRSAGYAVFPSVGKGGVIVGGAFGRGTVYDASGTLLGYATVKQGSVGGVIGMRSYSLLLVFENAHQLENFKAGRDLQFGAEATAIAIADGCSATTRYHDGVAVFAVPQRGLMADASLNGQQFRFQQRDEPTATSTAHTGSDTASTSD